LKTALTLTGDQLEQMMRYVRERIESLDEARNNGWLAERERFESEWNDDFSHREWENPVFAKSNESLNMVGAGVDYVRCRMLEEIFGSKPWFFADPRNAEGQMPEIADQVGRHLRWKLGPDQVDFEGVSTDLVTQACKLGECVAKVFYKTDEESFERVASILWDTREDRAVLSADGDLIFQESATAVRREFPESEPRENSGNEAPNGESEWHPGDGTAMDRPGSDAGGVAQSEWSPEYCWKERIVSDHVTRYRGAKAVPLHYKEFYCPLNAPSLHEADFVAHMTSMRLSELCSHLGISTEKLDGSQGQGKTESVADYLSQALRQIRQASAEPKSASKQALSDESEESLVRDSDPEFRLVEAYFQFDARGDGRPCRVFLMAAFDFDLPIFWDYIANVTPSGRYPFEVVVTNKEPHRWYGRSWFKKFESSQSLIDKLLNQVLYRNELAANPVKFRRKEAVVQWQDDQPFEIGPDKVFDLNDGYTSEDALQMAEIPAMDEQTKFLLEIIVANWRSRSGVITASQGTFGGMPSEHTATGIAQIATTATTIFKPQLMGVKRGLESVLRQIVEYQYTFQDNDEAFTYLDGESRVTGLLTREDVQGLECDVELTLTRAKQTQSLDASRLAVDFFGKFLAVPDEFKPVAAPLFTTLYKSLQIDNADDYFRQVAQIAQRPVQPQNEGAPDHGGTEARQHSTH